MRTHCASMRADQTDCSQVGFWGGGDIGNTEEEIGWGIGAYAFYSVFNAARAQGLIMTTDVAVRALEQAAREGALGCKRAEKALDSAWMQEGAGHRRKSRRA